MSYHTPVLLKETIAWLVTGAGIYVDGTLGGGGHSEALLQELEAKQILEASLVIGIDRDGEAITAATERLKDYKNFRAVRLPFSDLNQAIVLATGARREIQGVMLDLGISSRHLDSAERGFSFQKSGALDMRMSREGISARDIVNDYEESRLADVLYHYGEEKKSRFIARRIIERRAQAPIETTDELALIVKSLFKPNDHVKVLARVFQALRIEVNDELGELKTVLNAAHDRLKIGGRLVVISYHSLEDRQVKDFFREKATEDWGPKGVVLNAPIKKSSFHILTKKPIQPSEPEIEQNPRSRSAKLRAAEKR
jgi:16S rRNA (cytosine1402-N4)-methyltransferase